MSVFSKPTQSYTFGVKNESEKSIEVTLDFSGSENLIFSAKGHQVKKTVKAGEM
jgi:hypothetical protein